MENPPISRLLLGAGGGLQRQRRHCSSIPFRRTATRKGGARGLISWFSDSKGVLSVGWESLHL